MGVGKQSSAARAYLACYDAVLFLGWALVASWMLMRLGQEGHAWLAGACWSELATAMWVLQAVVLLDVLHACLGMWGPSEISLLKRIWCKVGRRTELFVTIALLQWSASPNTEQGLGLGAAARQGAAHYGQRALGSQTALGAVLVTWALSDVIRYAFYACSSLRVKPAWLLWLRYSVFLVQYPAVLVAELSFVTQALPALLQMGLLPLEGPFEALTALGLVELLPRLERLCLVNYCWIAVPFQARAVLKFIPYYCTLWTVRQARLGVGRPQRGPVAAKPLPAQRWKKNKQMDELIRCEVPSVSLPLADLG